MDSPIYTRDLGIIEVPIYNREKPGICRLRLPKIGICHSITFCGSIRALNFRIDDLMLRVNGVHDIYRTFRRDHIEACGWTIDLGERIGMGLLLQAPHDVDIVLVGGISSMPASVSLFMKYSEVQV